MKPGFEVKLVDQLLQEQEVKAGFSKIPALSEHYNQRALIYDVDFDKVALTLALAGSFLMLGSAFYYNLVLPLYLLAFVFVVIFLASMALRLQRENFYKAIHDQTNELKNKVQMAAEHNVSYLLSKIKWVSLITWLSLSLIAACAVGVSEIDLQWPLYLASPVVAFIICLVMYYGNWKNLRSIYLSFQEDIQKEILNNP